MYIITDWSFPDNIKLALCVELLFVSIADLFVVYYSVAWIRRKYEFLQKIKQLSSIVNDGKRHSFSSFVTKRIHFHNVCSLSM